MWPVKLQFQLNFLFFWGEGGDSRHSNWALSIYSPERCQCPINFRNYKCQFRPLHRLCCFLYLHLSFNEMNSCTRRDVYFSILQHKLVLLLPRRTFTVSFPQSLITTGNVNWLQQTSLHLICVNTF